MVRGFPGQQRFTVISPPEQELRAAQSDDLFEFLIMTKFEKFQQMKDWL
jgi:hypothetical protein